MSFPSENIIDECPCSVCTSQDENKEKSNGEESSGVAGNED